MDNNHKIKNGKPHIHLILFATEYATVGYMAKRIQMRKNRFQKIAESMKAARENPGPPGVPGDHGDHAPKQTVSNASYNLNQINYSLKK